MNAPERVWCNVPKYARDLLSNLKIQIKHLTNYHSSAINTTTFLLGMLQQKLYSVHFEIICNQNLFL